ncbi:MAG: hypothetical protein SFY92_01610 [Verrucomicrobiae bacterium]|nr:hypothetical protein [Verrucomicrobiae bacterium]
MAATLPPLKSVFNTPSWTLKSKSVEASVSRTGGHLGPVTFIFGKRRISPLSVCPWHAEKPDPSLPPLLQVLRGDFLCLPFGGNDTPYKGRKFPPHGEPANSPWHLESADLRPGIRELHLSQNQRITGGRVDKFITLLGNDPVLYQSHVISGIEGPMNPGHHAIVRFPETPGSGHISVSRFVHAQTLPTEFELPENGGYSSLKPDSPFSSLKKVPLARGGFTDISIYPARKGFEDLIMLVSDPRLNFAWTAVTFPGEGYVWFTLKDPRILRNTIFWISNGGRHGKPWNGRHTARMGLEECTSYFHYGLAESAAANPLSRKGYPTVIPLGKKRPTCLNTIMACALIPKGFDEVARIDKSPGGVTLQSRSGKKIAVPLTLGFLFGE